MIAGDMYGGVTGTRAESCPASTPLHKLQSATEHYQQDCARSMASHPLATLLVAITLGVTVGWLIKRR